MIQGPPRVLAASPRAGTARASCLHAAVLGFALAATGPPAPAQEQDRPGTEEARNGETEAQRIRRLGDALSLSPEEEWVPTLPDDLDEQRIARLLEQARALRAAEQLTVPAGDAAVDRYVEILALDPDHAEAASGLRVALDVLETRVRETLAAGNRARAAVSVDRLRALAPAAAETARAAAFLARFDRIEALRAAARAAEAAQRWGGVDGAIAGWQAVLAAVPGDAEGEEALVRIGRRLAGEAIEAANADRLVDAVALARLAGEHGRPEAVERVTERLAVRAGSAIAGGAWELAEARLASLRRLAPARAEELAQRLEAAWIEVTYPPGTAFTDPGREAGPGTLPRLVVLRLADGRRVALGETEVTVGQFRAFVEATGHRTDAERGDGSLVFDARAVGFEQREAVDWRSDYEGEPAADDLPVVHVSWNDARAYTDWLSAVTGERYRLPTGAEFEAAASADALGPYWWGEGSPEEPVENLAGLRDRLGRSASWSEGFAGYRDGFWGPAPVEAFPPNPAGFRNTLGNVMEWSADCYAGARPACTTRTIRGGGWSSRPEVARIRHRSPADPGERSAFLGFRVARELGR